MLWPNVRSPSSRPSPGRRGMRWRHEWCWAACRSRWLTPPACGRPRIASRRKACAGLLAAAGHLADAERAELPELRGEDLRLAMRELGRITGHVGVEDILDTVFSRFCIGK